MSWLTSFLFLFLFLIISSELCAYYYSILYKSFMLNLKGNVKVLDVSELKFKGYMKDFNKRYDGEEYRRRFENFKVSLKDIAKLNALEGNTVFGLTKFSDMSKEEFTDRMLLKSDNRDSCHPVPYMKCGKKLKTWSGNYQDFPPSFDWRNEGVVKPVLDQKLCQGCWAFSIVGVIESMSAIRGLSNNSLSVQELLDCSNYTNGCNYGSVVNAMSYICLYNLAFVTAEKYPMTLSIDQNCMLPKNFTGIRITNYSHKCNMNENVLVSQLYSHGPLVAAVDARNWQHYISGVIRRACSPHVSSHVVQIVGYEGYGYENETFIPYYIIKNSMGEDFGENGYVKIAMNGNICGIADEITMIDVV